MDNTNNWRDALTTPEETGWYLVYMNPCAADPQSSWRFDVVKFNKSWVINYVAVVTHWMPLPKPPEEL